MNTTHYQLYMQIQSASYIEYDDITMCIITMCMYNMAYVYSIASMFSFQCSTTNK